MRRLCSLCNKSTFLSFFFVLLPFLLFACYSMHLVNKTPPPPVKQDFFPTVKLIDEHGSVIATATPLSCRSTAPLRLQVDLHSTSLTFTPTFVVSANNAVHVEIDGLVVTPPSTLQADYLPLQQALCRAVTRHGRIFYSTADKQLLSALLAWLQLLSPPCKITHMPTQGFHCDLHGPEAQPQTLARIKRRMVSTWQRQPYLLMRRLALALDLANILAAGDTQRLVRFCHVLQRSYVRELPLVFTSQRWQQSVCPADNSQASWQHAALGLAAAAREITLFKRLFERLSRRGNVAVRLDAPMQHRFWVLLKPTAATLAATAQQYQQVLAADTQDKPTSSCWHPFFAEDASLHALAQAIGLHQGHCATTHYPQAALTEHNQLLGDYLVAAITSETEFAISNGRAKFLRLPPGTYDYRISHLPNYYLPATPAEIASGSIQWRNKRRNHQVLR